MAPRELELLRGQKGFSTIREHAAQWVSMAGGCIFFSVVLRCGAPLPLYGVDHGMHASCSRWCGSFSSVGRRSLFLKPALFQPDAAPSRRFFFGHPRPSKTLAVLLLRDCIFYLPNLPCNALRNPYSKNGIPRPACSVLLPHPRLEFHAHPCYTQYFFRLVIGQPVSAVDTT